MGGSGEKRTPKLASGLTSDTTFNFRSGEAGTLRPAQIFMTAHQSMLENSKVPDYS